MTTSHAHADHEEREEWRLPPSYPLADRHVVHSRIRPSSILC
jgi:hypothetical protein